LHEFSTAQQLVKTVLEVAESNQAKEVSEVEIDIGGLTHLSEEPLRFAFSIMAKGTLMEDAAIKIKYLPAILRCKKCRSEKKVNVEPSEMYGALVDFKCRGCGAREAEIDGDTSCIVKSIKVKK